MLRTPPILNLPELRIASGARLALDLAQVVSESTLGVRISNSRDPKSRVSRKESGAYAVPIAIRPMATAVKGRGSIGSHSNYRAAFALQCLVREELDGTDFGCTVLVPRVLRQNSRTR
jgi:hypothetical protein